MVFQADIMRCSEVFDKLDENGDHHLTDADILAVRARRFTESKTPKASGTTRNPLHSSY